MREVQEDQQGEREEEVLLRWHLDELQRHPLIEVPVRNHPLACRRSRDLVLPELVFQVR